jgi:chromate reductase
MTKFKLGVIVGSNRRESINRKLSQALVRLSANQFEASSIPIGDRLLYNQDLEAAMPASVARFTSNITGTDALLLVTPEHSRSMPTLLKNAIDLGACPYAKSSWPGKPAAVIGTSGDAISTAVAQQHLRAVLGNLGLRIAAGEAYIQFKPDLIDAHGAVSDDSVRSFLKRFVGQFAAFAAGFVPERAQRVA